MEDLLGLLHDHQVLLIEELAAADLVLLSLVLDGLPVELLNGLLGLGDAPKTDLGSVIGFLALRDVHILLLDLWKSVLQKGLDLLPAPAGREVGRDQIEPPHLAEVLHVEVPHLQLQSLQLEVLVLLEELPPRLLCHKGDLAIVHHELVLHFGVEQLRDDHLSKGLEELPKLGVAELLREIGDYVGSLLLENLLELILVQEVELPSHVGPEVHLGNAVLDLLGPGELDEPDLLGDPGHLVAEDRDSLDLAEFLELGVESKVPDQRAQVLDDDYVPVLVPSLLV